MKKSLLALLAMVIAVMMVGCTTPQIAKTLADRVCDATPERRALLGHEVNAAIDPHVIDLECDANVEVDLKSFDKDATDTPVGNGS